MKHHQTLLHAQEVHTLITVTHLVLLWRHTLSWMVNKYTEFANVLFIVVL